MANLLIVDDDHDVSEIVCDLLQRAGHFVRTAGTGEEGLRVLRAAQCGGCAAGDSSDWFPSCRTRCSCGPVCCAPAWA